MAAEVGRSGGSGVQIGPGWGGSWFLFIECGRSVGNWLMVHGRIVNRPGRQVVIADVLIGVTDARITRATTCSLLVDGCSLVGNGM